MLASLITVLFSTVETGSAARPCISTKIRGKWRYFKCQWRQTAFASELRGLLEKKKICQIYTGYAKSSSGIKVYFQSFVALPTVHLSDAQRPSIFRSFSVLTKTPHEVLLPLLQRLSNVCGIIGTKYAFIYCKMAILICWETQQSYDSGAKRRVYWNV